MIIFLPFILVGFAYMIGFRVAQGYQRGQPIPVVLMEIGRGLFMRHDAAVAFKQMVASAAKDGVTVQPSAGSRVAFRDWDMQAALRQELGTIAAPPGRSNHQGGIAIDLDTDRGTNAAYRWLEQNASKYGFFRTVSSEPWHWEYLGVK